MNYNDAIENIRYIKEMMPRLGEDGFPNDNLKSTCEFVVLVMAGLERAKKKHNDLKTVIVMIG